jgi:hypothetical protein
MLLYFVLFWIGLQIFLPLITLCKITKPYTFLNFEGPQIPNYKVEIMSTTFLIKFRSGGCEKLDMWQEHETLFIFRAHLPKVRRQAPTIAYLLKDKTTHAPLPTLPQA